MPCIQQLVALKSQDQSIATFPRLHLEEPSPLRSGGQQGLLLHLDRLREVFPGGLEVTHGILGLAVNPMPPPESPSSERASVQKKKQATLPCLPGYGLKIGYTKFRQVIIIFFPNENGQMATWPHVQPC